MPTHWSDADLAACRAALANGSRTFLAASLLLPRAVREPACALYAFCRLADDAVDGGGDPHVAAARLRERLDRLYRGDPQPEPADRALAAVVERFGIPQVLPAALIEGFEWDAAGRRYEDDAAALARACDLGVAMQLSNIARDVGEDARNGRLYLPLQWLHEAGLDPAAWLAAPRFDARLAAVLRRLLDHADGLYARVGAGVARLPLACRPSINAARFLYAAIGHEVARNGFDSVSARAVVPARRKAAGLLRALVTLAPSAAAATLPPLPATRFLVDAAAEPGAAPGGAYAKALWVIDLFERLERRDRLQRAA
jgi:phytoene synthase